MKRGKLRQIYLDIQKTKGKRELKYGRIGNEASAPLQPALKIG